jgi:hypothetical protein
MGTSVPYCTQFIWGIVFSPNKKRMFIWLIVTMLPSIQLESLGLNFNNLLSTFHPLKGGDGHSSFITNDEATLCFLDLKMI